MSDSFKSLKGNTGLRLMVLFGSFCILLALSGGIFMLLSGIPGVEARTALLLASAVQCVLAFCVPAWLCARFASDHSGDWLGLETPVSFKGVVGVLLLYILVLPAMNQLIAWNAAVSFPEWASGLEKSLRDMEDAAADTTSTILSFSGFGGMLATIGVVGILTGFSEELFFRGALQKVLLQSRMGVGISVWLSAFVFSAVHFQFFGFVPRLLMGAMFGYLFVWSRSLWLPIFAHALNNSIVVATAHIIGEGNGVETTGKNIGVDTLGIAADGEIPWAAIASAIATGIFLYRFRRYFFSAQG